MAVFTYQVPVTYTPEDNETRIVKSSILVKDCTAFGNALADCEGWNFNHCPNDDNYCQPFIAGDKIYSQLRVDRNTYFHIITRFWNSTTDMEFDAAAAVTLQPGTDPNRTFLLNAIIDTSHAAFAGVTCFYMTIKLFKCDYSRQGSDDFVAFNNCKAAKIALGMTAAEAKDACYEELCEDFDEIISEPWCLVRCEDPTILIEGTYPKWDCNGNWYGPVLSGGTLIPSIHKCQVRVYGSVEQSDFDITETVSGNKIRTSATLRRIYNLQTRKIPLYVAEKMALCFAGKQYFVDGVEYKGAVKFNKQFEDGRMWIVKVPLQTECDENNFTCQ